MKTIDWRRAAALAVLTAGGLGAQVRAQAPATVGAASPSTGRNVYLAGGKTQPVKSSDSVRWPAARAAAAAAAAAAGWLI